MLLLSALSPSVRAEGPDAEARAHELFQQGIEAVQRGELVRATEQFEAAQALSPNPVVLYNLGQAYSALGWSVRAEHALELYLESQPRSANPKRIEEVRSLLEFNAHRIGTLVVELAPSDATLEVDGAPPIQSPPGRIRLDAGRHVLVATRADYESQTVSVDVPPAEEVSVRIALGPRAQQTVAELTTSQRRNQPPVASPVPERSAPPHQRSATSGMSVQRKLGVVSIATGGLALAAGGAFGLAAIGLKNSANQNGHCDERGCDPEGMSLLSSAVRNGNWATGLCISGAVAVTLGLTLLFLDGHETPPGKAPSPGKTGRKEPALLVDPELVLKF